MVTRRTKVETIPMITNGKFVSIDVDTIQFIEQKGRKMYIVTDDNTMHIVIGRLEELAKYLQGKAFYRPMKSLVVNMDKIIAVSKISIHFYSGVTYGLGRNNLLKIRKAYKNYIFGYAPFGDDYSETYSRIAEENEVDLIDCTGKTAYVSDDDRKIDAED